MCAGKVGNMDVIAHAGTVGSRIVVAEDGQVRNVPLCRHEGTRNEMRLRIVPFADFAFRIGATRIEIPQRHVAESISSRMVLQYMLGHELAAPIGIDGKLRGRFPDRKLGRYPVGRAATGKDDAAKRAYPARLK